MRTYREYAREAAAEHARRRLEGLLTALWGGGFPEARVIQDDRWLPAPTVVEVPLPNGSVIVWEDDAESWWYNVWAGEAPATRLVVRSTATPDAGVLAVTRELAARYGGAGPITLRG